MFPTTQPTVQSNSSFNMPTKSHTVTICELIVSNRYPKFLVTEALKKKHFQQTKYFQYLDPHGDSRQAIPRNSLPSAESAGQDTTPSGLYSSQFMRFKMNWYS